MAKAITSLDVARRAGVSQPTVSRVFNAKSRVAEETRTRVLAAARALGYQPHRLAGSLSMPASRLVGIIAQVSHPFCARVVELLTQRLQQLGRQTLLFGVGPDQTLEEIVPLALQYRLDGLIIASATLSMELAAQCGRQGLPVVLLNRYLLGASVSAVCCDHVEGGRLVANLLLDAGHTRLAIIAGRTGSVTDRDREAGFAGRLAERGCRDWRREASDPTYESGAAAARRLLCGPDRPDAIFCITDVAALGALDVARYEYGLRVPDEVSIIGFDDLPAAAWPTYALTTIRVPIDGMVERALQRLLERINHPGAEPAWDLLAGQFVKRASARLPV